MISFGINENDKVIMWLLDIQNLNVNEQYYLRSENVPSDHSISSEFYEAQIEVKWADGGLEKQLLNKRVDFNEKVLLQYNLSLSQLDTETIRISKKIQKVILNTLESKKFYQKNNSSIWIYGIFKLPHLRKIQTPRKELFHV